MLTVETIGRIRREHFLKGKTIKAIARDLRVSRNTVRKVLRSGETSFEYERDVQPRPKLGRWTEELDALLAGNATKAAREQLTLIRIFEELRERGYDGGYDAVRRYARRWANDLGQATATAYVPLSFAPGEAYQFDWSHEVVLLNGTTVIVKAAHVRLCHSRMLFVRVYPRETQEMVFDAHDRAFALFKGACGRGIYDNMKTAVETIFVGKQRLYNRRFLQMCSHYLVDPVACTPASGWEKGQVENQVGLVRERFFTPRLRFKNLDELNAWLLDKCIAYAKAHRHPERMRPSTSIAKPSLVNSSVTVRHLSCCPLAQRSNTKSYDHTWFGPDGACGRGRTAAMRFLGRLRGTCKRATRCVTKPFFREPFKRRRCLMPVSGYYEWQDTPHGKQPWYFTARDGSAILTAAGLWDEWKNRETGEKLKSCTMIITEPNSFVAEVHDRMPALLSEDQFTPWLNGEAGKDILLPAPNNYLQRWPVSKRVNGSKADKHDAALVNKVELAGAQ